MRFKTLFIPFVAALSLVSLSGCAADADPGENVDQADQADSVGDAILCAILHCEPDFSGARWVKLGETAIDGLWDHGNFDVDSRLGRVSQVQLRIREGGVNIDSFSIYLRDGSRFAPNFDQHYGEGERSDVVSLPRPQRIDSVSISGSKELFGTGSVVELWARR